MKRDFARLAPFMLALLALACAEEFSPPSLIDKLRIIAVRATPNELCGPAAETCPETNGLDEGGTSALSALVVDPDGLVSDAQYGWYICGLRLTAAAKDLSCANDATALISGKTTVAVAVGDLLKPLLVLLDPALQNLPPGLTYQDLQSLPGLEVPAEVKKQFEDKYPGIVYLKVTKGEQAADAIKRVMVVPQPTGNRNPEIAGLYIRPAGEDEQWKKEDPAVPGAADLEFTAPAAGVTVVSGGRYLLRVVMTADWLERYEVPALGGQTQTVDENLVVAVFSTAGDFERGHTGPEWGNGIIFQTPPAIGKNPIIIHIFMVAVDGRGGTGWAFGSLTVQPGGHLLNY